MRSRRRCMIELSCMNTFHSLGESYEIKCIIRNNSLEAFFNLRVRFEGTRYEEERCEHIDILEPHDPTEDALEITMNISVRRSFVGEHDHMIEDIPPHFQVFLEKDEVGNEVLASMKFSRRLQLISCPTFSRFLTPSEYIPTHFNLLLFGKVSSGKTSMLNAFHTLLNRRMEISQHGNVKDGDDHCTKTIQRYEFRKDDAIKGVDDFNFSVTDCWGLDDENYDDYKFLSLLEGGLPGNWRMDYTFELYQELLRTRPDLIVENKIYRKIHCVLFVITFEDVLKFRSTGDRIKKFFDKLRSIVRDPIIVISRTDDRIPQFRENFSENIQMERIRGYVSKKLLVSRNDIFFGINYVREKKISFGIDKRNFQILHRSLCVARRNYLNSMVEISIEYKPHIFGESYPLQVHLRNKTKKTLRHLRLYFLETSYENEAMKCISFLPPHEEDTDPSMIVDLKIERKRNSHFEEISGTFQISLETDSRDRVFSRRKFKRDLLHVASPTIRRIKPPPCYFSKTYNLLLLGSGGSGKSSFINSVYTLLNPSRRVCSFVKTTAADVSDEEDVFAYPPSSSSSSKGIERYDFNEEGHVDFTKEYSFSITECLGLENLEERELDNLLIGKFPQHQHSGASLSSSTSSTSSSDDNNSSNKFEKEEPFNIEKRKVHSVIYFIDYKDLLMLMSDRKNEENQRSLLVIKMLVSKLRKILGEYPVINITRADNHLKRLRKSPVKCLDPKMRKLKSILSKFLGMENSSKIHYGINYNNKIITKDKHISSFEIDLLNFSVLHDSLKQAERTFVGLAERDFSTELERLKNEIESTKHKVQDLLEKMNNNDNNHISSSSSFLFDNQQIRGRFKRRGRGRYAFLVGQKTESCVYTSQIFEEGLVSKGYETMRISDTCVDKFFVAFDHFLRKSRRSLNGKKSTFIFYFCGSASENSDGRVILEFLGAPQQKENASDGKEEEEERVFLDDLLRKFDEEDDEGSDRKKKKKRSFDDVFVVIDVFKDLFNEGCEKKKKGILNPPRISNFRRNVILGFCETIVLSNRTSSDDEENNINTKKRLVEEEERSVGIRICEFSCEILKEMKYCVPFYQILTRSSARVRERNYYIGSGRVFASKKVSVFVDFTCSESVLDSCL